MEIIFFFKICLLYLVFSYYPLQIIFYITLTDPIKREDISWDLPGNVLEMLPSAFLYGFEWLLVFLSSKYLDWNYNWLSDWLMPQT